MPPLKINPAATPAALGYQFPAEWEPHAATWLSWPHNADDWPGKFETIPWVYGEMVRKISAGEGIRLIVRHKKDENFARRIFKHAGVDLRKVKFVTHPTDRGWTRDTGPIFVKRSPNSQLPTANSDVAIVHFHFNGWAKYGNWRKDTKGPRNRCKNSQQKIISRRVQRQADSSLKAAALR